MKQCTQIDTYNKNKHIKLITRKGEGIIKTPPLNTFTLPLLPAHKKKKKREERKGKKEGIIQKKQKRKTMHHMQNGMGSHGDPIVAKTVRFSNKSVLEE